MKPGYVAALLFFSLALSQCAQQSAFDAALPKLRSQCDAGDNNACEKIAEGVCGDETPETCRAKCNNLYGPAEAEACAEYAPEDKTRQGPQFAPL
jgi:hypothetical protein